MHGVLQGMVYCKEYCTARHSVLQAVSRSPSRAARRGLAAEGQEPVLGLEMVKEYSASFRAAARWPATAVSDGLGIYTGEPGSGFKS